MLFSFEYSTFVLGVKPDDGPGFSGRPARAGPRSCTLALVSDLTLPAKSRRPGTVASLTSGICALAILGYGVWANGPWVNPGVEEIASSALLISLDLLAGAVGLVLATRKEFDVRLRRGWALISAGMLCNAVAEALWFYYAGILMVDPFPSTADVFYLLFYPLMLAGILSLPFAPLRQSDVAILWLDLGIVLSASVMVFWYFIVAPILAADGVDLGTVVSVAYPVGDFLLLGGLVALIQRDVERVTRGMLGLLVLAIAFTTVADTFFAYYESNALPYDPIPLNLLWMASALSFMASAAWQLTMDHRLPLLEHGPLALPRRNVLRLILPYLGTAIGLGLLGAITLTTSLRPALYIRGAVQGALVLTGLVLLRQYIILRQNIALEQETRRLAVTDGLTGIYNRRHLETVLNAELSRAVRYGRHLSLLMIDLDGFKAYNDQFGHLKGDDVLKRVAQGLARHIRASDTLVRFGGDEFVVVLPETPRDQAEAVARKLQQIVAGVEPPDMPQSISVGLAELQPGMTPDDLLESADRALYQVKGANLQPRRDQGQASPA